MDLGSSFTYMFDDEEWLKKIAIGAGLSFLSLVLTPFFLVGILLIFPISGYMLQLLKNVRDGDPRPLPEWTNFGDLFMSGLMMFLIALVYNIPIILLSCISMPLNIAMQFPDTFSEEMLGVIGLLYLCTICIEFVVILLFNALLPAAYIRYAMTDSIGSAFQIGAILSFVKNNIGDYIIVILVGWVAGILAMFGLILCCVGIFVTNFWASLVYGHLYGQLAQRMDGDKTTINNDFAPAM